MSLKSAFPPHVDANTRLLILGSLPGDVSIARGEYYAHRGNAFWSLLGDILGEPLRETPYPQRLVRLRAHGVGLWDVVAQAERIGSLDSAIRSAELRDLATFVTALPALRAVAFNGKTAALHGRRQLGEVESLTLIDLPSSSGANASVSRAAKIAAWARLREWII
jgi:hypoxanthine-DNA glycosylase